MGVQALVLIKLCLAAATVGWLATCSGLLADNLASDEDSERSDETHNSSDVKSLTSWQREGNA
jgi:hypothetical protein